MLQCLISKVNVYCPSPIQNDMIVPKTRLMKDKICNENRLINNNVSIVIYYASRSSFIFYQLLILAAERLDLNVMMTYHGNYQDFRNVFIPPQSYWMFYTKKAKEIYAKKFERQHVSSLVKVFYILYVHITLFISQCKDSRMVSI